MLMISNHCQSHLRIINNSDMKEITGVYNMYIYIPLEHTPIACNVVMTVMKFLFFIDTQVLVSLNSCGPSLGPPFPPRKI